MKQMIMFGVTMAVGLGAAGSAWAGGALIPGGKRSVPLFVNESTTSVCA